MGSETLTIPTIDFSKPELKQGNPEWDLVRVQVQKALQEHGFFQALFDKAQFKFKEAIFDALEELFKLPLETKLRQSNMKPIPGYMRPHPEAPLFEKMFVEEIDPKKTENFTNLMWPEGHPNFCKTIQSFTKHLSELDQIIRRMVLESLGIEKYIDEHIEETNYSLRAMKYEAPKTTETVIGVPSHTDKTIFSILYPNQVEGLQVQSKDGEWISVKPSPDSLTVIIGDCLHAWTNGRLKSTHHRVMMSGFKERYSIELSSVPKPGYLVKVPEELVNEEHPLLFKPFEYIEYLTFFCTDEGQNAESALMAYCGI